MYYVYIHTLPNGKIYVGQSKDLCTRWQGEGKCVRNKEFDNDVEKYGWENVKHEIVSSHNNELDARVYEALLIYMLNSESESVGYNKTKYKEKIEKYYSERKVVGTSDFKRTESDKNIFESSGLPISACKELIDQWVFNKKYREIMKDRWLDGMAYQELSEKYKLSVRQLKYIVSDCTKSIEKHIP